MLVIDPRVGYDIAAAVGFLTSGTMLTWALVVGYKGLRFSKYRALVLFEIFIVASTCGLVSFCASFSILNLVCQSGAFDLSSALREDFALGRLTLRITSLILAYKLWQLALHALLVERFGNKKQTVDKPSRLAGVQAHEQYDCGSRDSANLAQYGIFILALAMLWTVAAKSESSIWTSAVSFTLLFFVDDFVIISEYANEVGGRMLPMHAVRIHLANLFLIASVAVASVASFQLGVAIIYFGGSLALVSWRYYSRSAYRIR